MQIFKCIKKCLAAEKDNTENITTKNKQQERHESQEGSKNEYLDINDFLKLDLRIGKIEHAERVSGSDKLIKCTVNFGDFGTHTIVSGIAHFRNPEEIVGKKYLYIVNLKPRKIFGIESQGMLVAVSNDYEFAMLIPDFDIKEGSKAS